MSLSKDGGLRIGELAELAGTTPRAIRHYHKLGLLVEPERDDSGYRRYGPQALVRLVRIRRLRSVDMPLEEIAANIGADPADVDIAGALASLARDIEQQIQGLTELRARVLAIAGSGSLSDPAASWETALRQHGILDQSGDLPPGEQFAARLVDALHPQGIHGVIEQMTDHIADPEVRQRLGEVLRRFQALPDEASDEVIDALAADYAAALPTPANPPPAIDAEMMEKLLRDRLSPAKLRCAQRVRELIERRQG
jgi:DNA-binding transcriptional MerR regulator